MSEFLTEEQRQAVNRLNLADLIDLTPYPKEKKKYCCPSCGTGRSLHDYHSAGRGWHCFGCGKDTLGILAEAWHIGLAAVKARLIEQSLIPGSAQEAPQETRQESQEAPLQGAAIQSMARQIEAQQTLARAEARLQAQEDELAKEAWQYLTEQRGLAPEIIKAFRLGCMTHKGRKAVSIPDNGNMTRYEIRYLDGQEPKVFSQEGLEKVMWLPETLHDPEAEAVFIVEGAIDGLSVWQTLGGGNSLVCALNSTSNAGKLVERIKELKQAEANTPRLILALDRDEEGQKTTEKLTKELAKIGAPFSVASFPDRPDLADKKGKIDHNDFMTKDQAGYKDWLEKAEAAPLYEPFPTLAEYVEQTFEDDKKEYQRGTLKTGWEKLDNPLSGIDGLHVGLCVIGGRPGIGKTTFCWQIVDSLANQDRSVLYFALEQSAFDMTLKTLSRKTGIPNWQIRSGDLTQEELGKVERAKTAYKPLAARLRVVEECSGIDEIISTIKDLHAQGKADCAFIDYLQIIPGEGGFKDRIEVLDTMMTKLRQTAREVRIPIVVISASNRNSYNQDSGLESYKGSSGIEYSTDVALVLQTAAAISTDENKKTANAHEIKKEMEKTDREMKLAITKNRYGGTHSIPLTYHADQDTFE